MNFGAQSRGFSTRCLRFKSDVATTSGLRGKRAKVDCIRPQHLEWFPGGEGWGDVPFAAILASITTVPNDYRQSLASASGFHLSCGRGMRGGKASTALRYGRVLPIFRNEKPCRFTPRSLSAMEWSMKIVTVDSADLKTVLSLLRVYRGVDRFGGHVKSLDAGPLDPFT